MIKYGKHLQSVRGEPVTVFPEKGGMNLASGRLRNPQADTWMVGDFTFKTKDVTGMTRDEDTEEPIIYVRE